jgi:hypothetical protein
VRPVHVDRGEAEEAVAERSVGSSLEGRETADGGYAHTDRYEHDEGYGDKRLHVRNCTE